jgi:uncharacterized membrane protein
MATRPQATVRGIGPFSWRFLLGSALSAAVAAYAFAYLAGIPIPPGIESNHAGRAWLVLHAVTGGIALLIGPWQFATVIRANRPRLHRMMGRCYVAACFVSGSAGMLLAVSSANGPIAQAGFAGLSASWLIATGCALAAALRHDFVSHRRWMIRSFALTCAAITLRIYIPAMLIADIRFASGYPYIAWLCWVPNLIVAEWRWRTNTIATVDSQIK